MQLGSPARKKRLKVGRLRLESEWLHRYLHTEYKISEMEKLVDGVSMNGGFSSVILISLTFFATAYADEHGEDKIRVPDKTVYWDSTVKLLSDIM